MSDVSVVIATYNRAGQVKEAIDSVLAQTESVREVIVVDDGSRDHTREQLLAYGARIRPFFQKNGGASAARNLGMKAAQGEWIAFLDDDDVWVPQKIQKQMEVVRQNPRAGLVYTSDYAVDEQLKVLYSRIAHAENRGDVYERLLIKNFIFTSCVIALRKAVEQAGHMDPRFKFAQDWDLWLKICATYEADFVAEPMVLYRQSATGCLTRDMKVADRLKEMQTISREAQSRRRVSFATRHRAAFELATQWASSALVQGKNVVALPYAFQAMANRPQSTEGYRLLAHSLIPASVRGWARRKLRRGNSNPASTTTLVQQPPAMSSPPPVIIMNMFYSGLAIARDLAGTGLRVVGLSADRSVYGNFTRHCEVRFAPDSQSEPEQLAEFLRKIAPELSGAVIFPTRDADVVFLDRYRDVLKEYRLSIPSHDTLKNVLDKNILARIAHKIGVPAPQTMVANNVQELEQASRKIGFPCVVKPVSSYMWRGTGKWETVGCRKAFRVDDWQQLKTEYLRVAPVHSEVLIQEWIPGSMKDIAVMGGYFGRDSDALGYFCARKLVQEPEDFGTGCVVQNLELREIIDPSLRLCKELNYRGMAEIEFKRDENGQYKLIEINTRHWDWHELGHMSGINLSRVAYSDLTGVKLESSTARRTGGKWVAEDSLLLLSAAGILHRKLKLRALMRELSGPKMFGIFRWADPMPFLHYLGSMLPGMSRMAIRKIWNKG